MIIIMIIIMMRMFYETDYFGDPQAPDAPRTVRVLRVRSAGAGWTHQSAGWTHQSGGVWTHQFGGGWTHQSGGWIYQSAGGVMIWLHLFMKDYGISVQYFYEGAALNKSSEFAGSHQTGVNTLHNLVTAGQ